MFTSLLLCVWPVEGQQHHSDAKGIILDLQQHSVKIFQKRMSSKFIHTSHAKKSRRPEIISKVITIPIPIQTHFSGYPLLSNITQLRILLHINALVLSNKSYPLLLPASWLDIYITGTSKWRWMFHIGSISSFEDKMSWWDSHNEIISLMIKICL